MMNAKRWLAGALCALVVGGTLAVAQPALSYAAGAAPQGFAGIGAAAGQLQGSLTNLVSSILGLDSATVLKERQAGKSLVDIAKSKGVAEQKLVDDVVTERKAVIDQRLKDGQITATQAEYCETNMEQRITANLNRTTVGPGSGVPGTGGGRGMGMGGRGQGLGCGNGCGYGYCQ